MSVLADLDLRFILLRVWYGQIMKQKWSNCTLRHIVNFSVK